MSGQPSAQHPGKWTNTYRWDHVPVHQMLLPSDTADAQIFWYRGDESLDLPFSGSSWYWTFPGDSAVNAGTYPTANFSKRPIPDPSFDVFCSGHAHLADGRILIVGGNEEGEIGLKKSVIFDFRKLNDAGGPWVAQPDMGYRRWYPNAGTQPDGKVLVLSGSQYRHMNVFGGVDGSGQKSDSLRRLGMAEGAGWDPSLVPLMANGTRPEATDGINMMTGGQTGDLLPGS